MAQEQVYDKFKERKKKDPSLVRDPKDQKIKEEIDKQAREYNRHQKTLFIINHPNQNALKLSTIHSFKGQESNMVILLLTDALMKSRNSALLIYAAISRAKEKLVVFDAVSDSPQDPWYSSYLKYKKFFEEMDRYFRNG